VDALFAELKPDIEAGAEPPFGPSLMIVLTSSI
jgi:hypothetical protein